MAAGIKWAAYMAPSSRWFPRSNPRVLARVETGVAAAAAVAAVAAPACFENFLSSPAAAADAAESCRALNCPAAAAGAEAGFGCSLWSWRRKTVPGRVSDVPVAKNFKTLKNCLHPPRMLVKVQAIAMFTGYQQLGNQLTSGSSSQH